MGRRSRTVLRAICAVLMLAVFSGGTMASPPVGAADQILEYLTDKVPEIKEMARKNPDNRLIMSVEATPDPQAAERTEREFYRVYVGFLVQDSGPGHRSRWATFLVHKNKTEILWTNYLADNSYVSLADWRTYIHAAPQEGVNDWMCIPFLRVGPIQPNSSINDLVGMFGAENVKQRTVYGPEAIGKFEASVIFPGTADELIVFWQDNKYGTAPASVSIRKQGSAWKTVQGIKIGTTLAALNDINGRPFSFFGFGWDYGGHIFMNWDEGAMSSVSGLFLVLRQTRELPRKYYGDRKLMSDQEELLPDGVRVSRIDVNLR